MIKIFCENLILSAVLHYNINMSKKSDFFQVWNNLKEVSGNQTQVPILIYGKETLAHFLRERGCKFSNEKIRKLGKTEIEMDFNEYTVEVM